MPGARGRASDGFTPRWYAIEQALRARIEQLPADAPLPSDAMLCDEFGVSRMTARNAVQRLVQEGLVYRVPGRGTFVAAQGAHRQAAKIWSFTDEMRRRGKAPSSEVLESGLREPTPTEAARLRLPAEEVVVVVRRLRRADGVPIAIEEARFPGELAQPILTSDLEQGSLHATLVGAGRVPTAGQATITAETAERAEAKLLAVSAGAALLVERRLIADQDGAPLELTESRYVAERYALDVDFVVEVTV
jgi:GntR family transcriptional regulator